ncbi:hypothetical protein E8E95_27620, partial [Pseudomonas sp. BN414]|nr:hypothetical protein [Pseudomonas sp. BN414]
MQTSAFSGVRPAGGVVDYISAHRNQLDDLSRPSWLRPIRPTRWRGIDRDIVLRSSHGSSFGHRSRAGCRIARPPGWGRIETIPKRRFTMLIKQCLLALAIGGALSATTVLVPDS